MPACLSAVSSGSAPPWCNPEEAELRARILCDITQPAEAQLELDNPPFPTLVSMIASEPLWLVPDRAWTMAVKQLEDNGGLPT